MELESGVQHSDGRDGGERSWSLPAQARSAEARRHASSWMPAWTSAWATGPRSCRCSRGSPSASADFVTGQDREQARWCRAR